MNDDIEEASNLGELKSIKRIPGMQADAPNIKWGDEYLALPVADRLKKAEKLASTMNHAADILQTERNKVIAVAQTQQGQIQMLNQEKERQQEIMHQELARHNTEKQKLSGKIVDLQRVLRLAKAHLKKLGATRIEA